MGRQCRCGSAVLQVELFARAAVNHLGAHGRTERGKRCLPRSASCAPQAVPGLAKPGSQPRQVFLLPLSVRLGSPLSHQTNPNQPPTPVPRILLSSPLKPAGAGTTVSASTGLLASPARHRASRPGATATGSAPAAASTTLRRATVASAAVSVGWLAKRPYRHCIHLKFKVAVRAEMLAGDVVCCFFCVPACPSFHVHPCVAGLGVPPSFNFDAQPALYTTVLACCPAFRIWP